MCPKGAICASPGQRPGCRWPRLASPNGAKWSSSMSASVVSQSAPLGLGTLRTQYPGRWPGLSQVAPLGPPDATCRDGSCPSSFALTPVTSGKPPSMRLGPMTWSVKRSGLWILRWSATLALPAPSPPYSGERVGVRGEGQHPLKKPGTLARILSFPPHPNPLPPSTGGEGAGNAKVTHCKRHWRAPAGSWCSAAAKRALP